MRVLVLCEGKSDAILISYLLERTSGWKYSKGDPNFIIKDIDEIQDGSAYWSGRGGDLMMICGVGGKENFGAFFSDKIFPPIKEYGKERSFDKLVYVVDRDNDSDADIVTKIKNDLNPLEFDMTLGVWESATYTDSFNKINSIEILGLVVPQEQEGALETALLNALSQNPYNKNIVDKCKDFVDEIKPEADIYITKPRLELKAKLSCVFAIISPQKVFSFIDNLIKSVNWEEYTYIKALFKELIEL